MRVLALLCLAASSQEAASSPPTAYRSARVHTVSGAVLENATLLVEKGRIAGVGPDVGIPAGAEVVDLAGRTVIPGLIDAASSILVPPGERAGGAADFDILDALDRYRRDPEEALEEGVTTVYVGPSSAGGVGGLGAVVRLDPERTVLASRCALKVTLGGGGGGETSSADQRYEAYRQLRQAFQAAKQYVEALEKHAKDLAEHEQKKKQLEAEKKPVPDAPAKPKTDPRNEVLARALDPKRPLPVRIEAHFGDSILHALRLAEEFKLRAVLECATEGARVAAEVARAGMPVVAGPVFRYGPGTVEYLEHSIATPAALARAGVPLAIGSFGDERAGHTGTGATRFLAESAALAASRGLTREQALSAITLQAARLLGIDRTHGSIEKGKVADFVVLTGEPFEAGTRVERTVLGGKTAFLRKGGEGGR